MDIEGAETRVLVDYRDALAGVEGLFVEHQRYADRRQDLHELLEVLTHAGFRYSIQPQLVAPRPFENQTDDAGIDQRLNVFAVRR